ncbi:MAG TPA: LON peptidase substrate-binding domain-containing protein [Longimicrobiales bacterium]|nr:LON peptidase substrate-binding domain-containing protein [Longimicrobiales bacterium]
MRRLPLFVLPVVLLPGATLPLHIFEPRYRRMAARCLESDRRFGVLYHDSESAQPFVLEEGLVGCVAEILEFRPLPDGRSLVLTRGEERFRVVDGIENEEEYHEALVEEFVDAVAEDAALAAERRRVIALFRALVELTATEEVLADFVFPTEYEGDVSFRIAALIHTDVRWHQALLELPGEAARLDQIGRLLEGHDL